MIFVFLSGLRVDEFLRFSFLTTALKKPDLLSGFIFKHSKNYFDMSEPYYRTFNYDSNNYNFIYLHKQDNYRNSYFTLLELWNSFPSCTKAVNTLHLFQVYVML